MKGNPSPYFNLQEALTNQDFILSNNHLNARMLAHTHTHSHNTYTPEHSMHICTHTHTQRVRAYIPRAQRSSLDLSMSCSQTWSWPGDKGLWLLPLHLWVAGRPPQKATNSPKQVPVPLQTQLCLLPELSLLPSAVPKYGKKHPMPQCKMVAENRSPPPGMWGGGGPMGTENPQWCGERK